MTADIDRDGARNCFVCGPDNPHGMHVQFRMEGEYCRAEFTPPAHLCGFDGITHGGILFSLLDDVMANWLFLQGERAYTGKCEVRYREPAEIGDALLLESNLIKRRGSTAEMAGRILRAADSTVVAEATARFVILAA